jgi:putative ABC transport system permease protein
MALALHLVMVREFKFAARGLRRAPGFTLSAVLTLAFGLCASTVIFTVLYAVLLRPLPYRDPGRLAVLLHEGQFAVSPADYLAYERQASSFSSLAAAQVSGVTLTGSGDPLRVDGLQVTANLFATLGVPPALGRTFVTGDDQPGRDRVVVLSDQLWRDRFGGDPRIIGQPVRLDGEAHTVIGVMPPRFQFAPFWATGARLWRPLSLAPRRDDRVGRSLRLFGRLADGATIASAQSEVSAIAAQLASAFPESNEKLGISVVPLHEKVTAGIRPTLVLLLAMVALVLLVACVNVATLLLVRGTARQRELSVRAALGASRAQLVRQLAAESLLLASAAGVLALVLASWIVAAVPSWLPPDSLPRQNELRLDPVVFLVSLGLVLMASLLAALAPALQMSDTTSSEAMGAGSRSVTEGAYGRRLRRAMLAIELTLALALLAGAGLMGRTLLALQSVDAGFDPSHVLVVTVPVNGLPQAHADRRAPYFDAVHAALERVPGVERVGAINHLPLAGDDWHFAFQIEGRPVALPSERPAATWRVVRPGYFEAMRLRVRGRPIDGGDRADSLPVVVVNETMAAKHWPGQDPIGRRVRCGSGADDPWLTVVGVSADARQTDWVSRVPEEVYVPYSQHSREFGGSELTFVLRTAGDPAAVATSASRAVWSVDRGVPIARLTTMERVVGEELWRPRLVAAMLAIFAVAALALAAVGIYSVTAYVMSRRAREIGIRLALGAVQRDVVRLALVETMLPVGIGLAAGTAASLALSRLVASLLYGVKPGDPLTFAAASLMLVTAGFLAGWLPARRAARVDPVRSLREE